MVGGRDQTGERSAMMGDGTIKGVIIFATCKKRRGKNGRAHLPATQPCASQSSRASRPPSKIVPHRPQWQHITATQGHGHSSPPTSSAAATRRATFDRIGEGHKPNLREQRMLFGGAEDPRIRNGGSLDSGRRLQLSENHCIWSSDNFNLAMRAFYAVSHGSGAPPAAECARVFVATSCGPPTSEVTPGRHRRCPARGPRTVSPHCITRGGSPASPLVVPSASPGTAPLSTPLMRCPSET